MRRELVQATAWAAATGAAVGVSWYGVHRVLSDDGYRQPSALALSIAGSGPGSGAPAPLPPTIGSATQIPAPPSAHHSAAPTPGHPRSATPSNTLAATTSPAASPSASASATGDVKSYTPQGGRVAVSMGASTASLVSATPDAGWSMHVYTGDQWLRVDFTSGSTDSAFYVTWNGHPPLVSTWVSG